MAHDFFRMLFDPRVPLSFRREFKSALVDRDDKRVVFKEMQKFSEGEEAEAFEDIERLITDKGNHSGSMLKLNPGIVMVLQSGMTRVCRRWEGSSQGLRH